MPPLAPRQPLLLAWLCSANSQADVSLLQVAGIDAELLGPACPWLQTGNVHGSGMGYFKLQPGGSQTDAPVDKTGVQVSGLLHILHLFTAS